jgi:hypothetical protein
VDFRLADCVFSHSPNQCRIARNIGSLRTSKLIDNCLATARHTGFQCDEIGPTGADNTPPTLTRTQT